MFFQNKAQTYTKLIYRMYANESGYLFGVPPTKKKAVEQIVETVLEIAYREKYKKNDNGG